MNTTLTHVMRQYYHVTDLLADRTATQYDRLLA